VLLLYLLFMKQDRNYCFDAGSIVVSSISTGFCGKKSLISSNLRAFPKWNMYSFIFCAVLIWSYSCTDTFGKSANDNGIRILIGAIRWDGCVSNTSGTSGAPGNTIGTDYDSVLTPIAYQNRLPFYAQVTNPNNVRKVTLNGTSATIINKEIEFARTHLDLDYWAFSVYESDANLSVPFNTYLAATRTDKPNFCFILDASFCKSTTMRSRVLSNLSHASYQTVTQGRPILYLNGMNDYYDSGSATSTNHLISDWKSLSEFKKEWDGWMNWATTSVGKRPYVVVMEFNENVANYWKNYLGADAISTYAVGIDDNYTTNTNYPYSTLATTTENFWAKQRLANSPSQGFTYPAVVPTAMISWNSKPFQNANLAWYPFVSSRDFSDMPTPAEAAQHIANCMNFLNQNPTSTPARTMLIYSWNEFGEGGVSLCPTYDPNNLFDPNNAYYPYTSSNSQKASPGFNLIYTIGARIKPYH
jgi:hypothetical protein